MLDSAAQFAPVQPFYAAMLTALAPSSGQRFFVFAIGAALTNVFGRMVGDQRQGWAILAAMGVLPQDFLTRYMVIGELSLDGEVRHVTGVLPMVAGTWMMLL